MTDKIRVHRKNWVTALALLLFSLNVNASLRVTELLLKKREP